MGHVIFLTDFVLYNFQSIKLVSLVSVIHENHTQYLT